MNLLQMTPSSLTRLALCTVFGFAAAAPAFALDAKLYGSVDKALVTTDDGRNTDSSVVDNHNNPTRFGLAGEQKLDSGLTASLLLEAGLPGNDSTAMTQNATVGAGTAPASTNPVGNFVERYARVGLASDKWGALFLGRQNTANDDSFGHDLAAVNELMNPTGIAVFGSGLVFRPQNNGVASVALSGVTLTPGAMVLGNDGSTTFAQSVRYNTPTFYGVNGSASYDQGGNVDLAARFNHKVGSVLLDGGVGYTSVQNNASTTANPINATFATTLSAKHDSGIAGTIGYASQSVGNKTAGISDPSGVYAKVGYNWGNYGVAADYAVFNHTIQSANNAKLNTYGLGADYDMGHGVVVGGLYRNYNADIAGTDLKSIGVYVLNMQVAF